jgi:RyR domain
MSKIFMKLPDVELVSQEVHKAWIKSKINQGFSSRKSEDGEELMVAYNLLSEKAKDLDRNTVKAVYQAIKKLSK